MLEGLKKMFQKPQMGRRLAMLAIAHLIMGLGVALLKFVTLGTDPFSAMMMALTAMTPLSYGTFCMLANCSFFVFEIWLARQYIGVGTIVNWFMLGYLVMFWNGIIGGIFPEPPQSLLIRVPLCVVVVVVLAFSLSLYQTADVGIAPFDSLPLIMRERLKFPFPVARMLTDGSALVVAFVAHGVLGLGTVLVVFGLGPVANFFNKNFSEKLLTSETDSEREAIRERIRENVM